MSRNIREETLNNQKKRRRKMMGGRKTNRGDTRYKEMEKNKRNKKKKATNMKSGTKALKKKGT